LTVTLGQKHRLAKLAQKKINGQRKEERLKAEKERKMGRGGGEKNERAGSAGCLEKEERSHKPPLKEKGKKTIRKKGGGWKGGEGKHEELKLGATQKAS